MDKSSESSDSDSNSSTSWVFVDEVTTSNQNAANTFHLDCSREPIQELTEQDLLSAGSDLESDTDGISVISESEVPTEESCTNIQSTSSSFTETLKANEEVDFDDSKQPDTTDNEAVEELHSESLVTTEEHVKPNLTEIVKNMKPLHLLGVGFVLVAVCVASYNQFMTKMSEKDFKKDNLALYDKIDLSSSNDLSKLCDGKHNWEKELVQDEMNNKKLYKVKGNSDKKRLNKRSLIKNDDDEHVEKIIDITVSCASRETPTNEIVNKAIKECATKEYQKQKEEIYVEDEDGFSRGPERKKVKYMYKYKESSDKDGRLVEDEYQMQATNFLQEHQQEFIHAKEDKNYNTNSKETEYKQHKEKSRKHKRTNEKLKTDFEMNENLNKDHKKIEKHNHSKKYNKYQTKEEKENYKKEFDYKHAYIKKDKRRDEIKQFNHKNKKSSEKLWKYETDTKSRKDYKNKRHESLNRNSRFENSEKKFNRFNDKHKKYVNNNGEIKYKNKLSGNYLRQRLNNTDGEWYTNMHKGRDRMRKQEHVSDWVFDRAHMRSQRRNKAQWYFKWMNIREQLRYKRSYKPYSS